MEAPLFAVSLSPSSSTAAATATATFVSYWQRSKRSFTVRSSTTTFSSSHQTVTLLNYGAANVRSLRNAIRHLGFHVRDIQKAEDIMSADQLVFPGAFGAAMHVLNQNGLGEALRMYIEKDKPFLGICLGLQLLFDSSEENGPVKGLGVIPGTVERFDSTKGLIVPHIGWNALQPVKDSGILRGIEGHHVYFVHSYRALPSDDNKDWISSVCNYGEESFISSVSRGNVNAVQFHPEKSGAVGLSILRNFLGQSSSGMKTLVPVKATKLAKKVVECLNVRANDKGDLVVTKPDEYDVRETTGENEFRNLERPVELASQYYKDGTDEISFLNITGFRDFPLGELPMLQDPNSRSEQFNMISI